MLFSLLWHLRACILQKKTTSPSCSSEVREWQLLSSLWINCFSTIKCFLHFFAPAKRCAGVLQQSSEFSDYEKLCVCRRWGDRTSESFCTIIFPFHSSFARVMTILRISIRQVWCDDVWHFAEKKIRKKSPLQLIQSILTQCSSFSHSLTMIDCWLLKANYSQQKWALLITAKKKAFSKRKRSRCQPTNSKNNSKSISTTWNVYVEGSAAVQRRRRPTRRSFCSCRSSKKEIIIKQSRAENARKWKLMWRRRRACVCMNV